MDLKDNIDDFFLIINDPRSVSPETFAKYYPEPGKFGNTKGLNQLELGKLFESRNKFKRPPNYIGYKPLHPRIISILQICETSNIQTINSGMEYFAHRAIDANTFISDFWYTDGLLDEIQIQNIVGMYMVFFKNIQSVVLLEIERFLDSKENGKIVVNKGELPFYCQIGALFAEDKISMNRNGFYFEDVEFNSIKKLADHIQVNVLNVNKNVIQYVNDTLKEQGIKNFYSSKKRMKNIISYCETLGISVSQKFLDKYSQLQSNSDLG